MIIKYLIGTTAFLQDWQRSCRFCPAGSFLWRYALNTHVGPENLGNVDRAIRPLIVLNDREPSAADSKTRAIQGVYEFAFAPFRPEADAAAAGLESLAIGARGDLAEGVGGRQPDFEIVGLGRGEAHIAGGELHDPVVQAEL